jgi:hypothetical protein
MTREATLPVFVGRSALVVDDPEPDTIYRAYLAAELGIPGTVVWGRPAGPSFMGPERETRSHMMLD